MKLKLKLEGITERGKGMITKYGTWWNVVSKAKGIPEWGIQQAVQYISPARLIRGEIHGMGSHWIVMHNDPNYSVVDFQRVGEKKEVAKAA